MIENVLATPFLVPLMAAVVIALFRPRIENQRRVTLVAGILQWVVASWLVYLTYIERQSLVLRVGNWEVGVGVVWIADPLSSLFLWLAAIVFIATVWSLPVGLDRRERLHFFPLLNLIMLGINSSFLTGDLFNLFVSFEVMLVASFVLISQGSLRERVAQAFPYVTINLAGSALFLFSVGVIYATTGTVNMAQIARLLSGGSMSQAFWIASFLVVIVFSIKASLVPWHFWLPDSYPASSVPVNAFFAGLLTKVGVYCLFRYVPILNLGATPFLNTILLWISVATMIVGVIGALGRSSMRDILSFHIVSQVGYMVFGLAVGSTTALAAGLFYASHHIVVKTALFFAVGIPELRSGTKQLAGTQGVAERDPLAAAVFLIPALGLAGLPPLSGFWGKFFLIFAGFEQRLWWATSLAIVVSLLTLASMLKIWNAVYWGSSEGQRWQPVQRIRRLTTSATVLAILSIAIGLFAGNLFQLFQSAAEGLLGVSHYIHAVHSEAFLSKVEE